MPNPFKRERLIEIVESMESRRIHLWADLVVDHYIYGVPRRVSREAPVLILKHDREWMVPGGGANTLNNLLAMGGIPLPHGIIGDDPPGHYLLNLCSDRGVDSDCILVQKDQPTITKVRILAGPHSGVKQQIVRYDRETTYSGVKIKKPMFKRDEFLVVSDYGYGTVDPDKVVKLASKGNKVVVDSRYDLKRFRGVYAVTPNQEEASHILQRDISTTREAEEAADRLRAILDVEVVMLTMGSYGMIVSTRNSHLSIPVYGKEQVADVTGAGDTVLAAFSLALAGGASPEEAAVLANYAGGIVVMKLGTATCSHKELIEAVQTDAG